MQSKTSVGILISFAGIFFVLVFSIAILFPTHAVFGNATSGGGIILEPSRLIISKIYIDAVIESVGLTPEGNMGAPKDPATVGWFSPPHQKGTKNIVLDGHSGWLHRAPAVFDDLHLLEKGDSVLVQDKSGATALFVVSEIRIVGEHEDASNLFYSADGKVRLVLITCEGVWNPETQNYAGRLVVWGEWGEEVLFLVPTIF